MAQQRRSRVLTGEVLLLACVISWLALEALARGLLGAPPGSGWTDIDEQYAERPLFAVDASGIMHASRLAGQSRFAARKAPGTTRVFLVGGSVVLPYRREPASALKKALERSLPGRRVELIVCGTAASDSWRDARAVAEAASYSADLIIVMTGNNEFFDPEEVPRLRLAAQHLAGQSWLWWRISSSGKRPSRWTADLRREAFRRNVGEMLWRARRARGRLILCTLPYDARDFAPRGLLAKQRFDRAENLERAGRREAASMEYRQALDADEPPFRSSPSRNAALRGLCRLPRCAIADLERRFASLAPDGLPGGAVFDSGCHWREGFYPLATDEIARAAAVALGQRLPAAGRFVSPRPRGLDEAGSSVAIAAIQASRPDGAVPSSEIFSVVLQAADPATTRWLSCPVFASQEGFEQAATHLPESLIRRGGRRELEASWPSALRALGAAHARLGRPEAAADCIRLANNLERARPWRNWIMAALGLR